MKHMLRLPYIVLLVALGGVTLYTYRELPSRAFAADDYQWLLNVDQLAPLTLLQQAFDPLAQQHFYRPLVWAMLWTQLQLFGLHPAGFHMVSLALHLTNAMLVGLLAVRLSNANSPTSASDRSNGIMAGLLACALVALHPAPFEAVVWISAQSELLGTCLLLLAIHLWISTGMNTSQPPRSASRDPWLIAAATGFLGLAMLAKESAILGLPLMLLLGWGQVRQRWAYLPPLLLSLAFAALQVAVGQQNRVLREGLYGIGPQLFTNPLRSLALVVAPLSGTEHADTTWLVWAGLIVALALLALLVIETHAAGIWRPTLRWRLIVALLLTLAPTAPFTSPPDSRYLYLPVALAAVLVGSIIGQWWVRERLQQKSALIGRSSILICALLAIWWGSGELTLREWRFAAGSGSGGSLWRLTSEICAAVTPGQVVLVDPPIALPHAEAIVHLACGATTRPLVVERAGLEGALKPNSVVIIFPGGSATVERWL